MSLALPAYIRQGRSDPYLKLPGLKYEMLCEFDFETEANRCKKQDAEVFKDGWNICMPDSSSFQWKLGFLCDLRSLSWASAMVLQISLYSNK